MEKMTPESRKKWIKLVVLGVFILAVLIPLWIVLDHVPAKGALITSPPGVATALRQIQWATAWYGYGLPERKHPSTLEDLVDIPVPTPEGRKTNFSISLLEQQLGTNISTINYFPGFHILNNGQVPSGDIVLAFVPDSKDTRYCQVVYMDSFKIKGVKWVGAERIEVARVHQKIEWLTAYKNAIESNLPPPTAPMPR